jgi:hypothetical protein
MKGIIFTATEVLALKAGLKTQTRRVIKRQPIHGEWIQRDSNGQWVYAMLKASENAIIPFKCPYSVGDWLYVKEAFLHFGNRYSHGEAFGMVRYLADGSVADMKSDSLPNLQSANSYWYKHRPAIWMPQWASRITLEITGIRAERLQDISDADIKAEGITDGDSIWAGSYRSAFSQRWDERNKKHPWVSNPFVWVYEHRTIR